MSFTDPITRSSLLSRLRNPEDTDAWDQFALIYGPVIYRVGLGRGLQTADAEDLVQEVLLAVHLSLGKWLERTDRGSFRAWLVRVARNEAVDSLTRRSTQALNGGSEAQQKLAQLCDPHDLFSALDREYEQTLFRQAAESVRKEVTESVWLAFWLTSVEGYLPLEAAAKLKTSVGNIYVARSRVMSRLKEHVAQWKELQ